MLATIRAYTPRGTTIDAEAFKSRHRFLCWVLGLHVPALFAFGVVQGFGVAPTALEVALPAACLGFARLARNQRLASLFVTAGLVGCSTILVHLSGGTIEAHFHYFIVIGLVALYQDWVPFVWNAAFVVLSHGIGSAVASDVMFGHAAGQARPWTWAVIHGVAVLAACTAQVVLWRHTELDQERGTRLAAELATTRTEVSQRRSVSELLVSLARRNQSLLDRQLALIAELEEREDDPDDLRELFRLDHLATRIRRNAESLLVLSGYEPTRRWSRPVPLTEVILAAAAEVEDFPRVEVLVDEHLLMAGRAVADVAHLLAELIENATVFSPPATRVRVRSHHAPSPATGIVLSITDAGIGMSAGVLQQANALLAEPQEVDLRRTSMLGFHVVGRLAGRYGIEARLADTPGGGVTALVTLPEELVSERPAGLPVTALAATVANRGRARMAGWRLPDADPATTVVGGTAEAEAPAAAAVEGPVRPDFVGTGTGPVGPPGGGWPAGSVTASGLARRVPFIDLGPALPAHLGADAAEAGADAGQAGADAAPPQRDPERVKSMLSRFQANQRAGRAAARGHGAVTPEEGR